MNRMDNGNSVGTSDSDSDSDSDDDHVGGDDDPPTIELAPDDHRASWLARAAAIVAVWSVVALLWTGVEAAATLVTLEPLSWRVTLIENAAIAAAWMLLTPLVLAAAARWRIHAVRATPTIALHVVLGLATATAHAGLVYLLLRAVAPDLAPTARQIAAGWFAWNFGAFLLLIAASHVREFAAWYRETLTATARTRAALARARLQTLRLQLQPSMMLGALDAIAEIAGVDPERCEWVITRVGDMLRTLLGTATRREIPLREEIALLHCHLEVQGARRGIERRSVYADRWALDALVPPVLLPPLFEALTGHGAAGHEIAGRGGAHVVTVTAAREAGLLRLELRVDTRASDGNGDARSARA